MAKDSLNPKEFFAYSDGATHAANEIAVASGQVDCATDFDRNRTAMIESGKLGSISASSGTRPLEQVG